MIKGGGAEGAGGVFTKICLEGIHCVARESMVDQTRDHLQIYHSGYQEISIGSLSLVLNFGHSPLLNRKTFLGFCFWVVGLREQFA